MTFDLRPFIATRLTSTIKHNGKHRQLPSLSWECRVAARRCCSPSSGPQCSGGQESEACGDQRCSDQEQASSLCGKYSVPNTCLLGQMAVSYITLMQVYRVDVLTEHDHWYMYKRYSQFYSMHSKVSPAHLHPTPTTLQYVECYSVNIPSIVWSYVSQSRV